MAWRRRTLPVGAGRVHRHLQVLRGFAVTVQCASSAHEENGVTTNVFRVTSLAEYGTFGDADYVSRRLEAVITTQP